MIKLKNLLKESFGLGELPSSKLMKMKMTLAELMDSEDVVNEAELPKNGSTIKVSNIPVKIEYVSGGKYIGYSWKDKNNKEHYEETKVSEHSDLNSLIKTITAEIRYQRIHKNESIVNEGQIADYQIGLKKVTKDDALEHMYGVDRPGKKWKQGMSVSTTAELKKLVKKYGNDNVVIHGKQNNGKPLVDILEGALTRK